LRRAAASADYLADQMTSAAELAKALGARRYGRQWQARCPAHNDHEPSLSIGEGDDGRILVHCHAGCEQGAVIDALRSRGLSLNGHDRDVHARREHHHNGHAERDADTLPLVNRIWSEGIDPAGTVAEAYLTSRKLTLAPELEMTVLRFHPACVWESGTAACLVAAFREIGSSKLTGLHRIRVDQPQHWPRTERKMLGAIAGSAIKLDPITDRLCVGEGLETVMAARQLGLWPCWSLGSAGAIAKFSHIASVEELTILGENDTGANRRAAEACRDNWRFKRVTLLLPTSGRKDFNDILLEGK
jgi:putative DNA primase/helicase